MARKRAAKLSSAKKVTMAKKLVRKHQRNQRKAAHKIKLRKVWRRRISKLRKNRWRRSAKIGVVKAKTRRPHRVIRRRGQLKKRFNSKRRADLKLSKRRRARKSSFRIKSKRPRRLTRFKAWISNVPNKKLRTIKRQLRGKRISVFGKMIRVGKKSKPVIKMNKALRAYMVKKAKASFEKHPYSIVERVKADKVRHFIPLATYKDKVETFKPYVGISTAQYGSKYQHITFTTEINNPGLDIVKVSAVNVVKDRQGLYQLAAGYAWTFGTSVVTYKLERERVCKDSSPSNLSSGVTSSLKSPKAPAKLIGKVKSSHRAVSQSLSQKKNSIKNNKKAIRKQGKSSIFSSYVRRPSNLSTSSHKPTSQSNKNLANSKFSTVTTTASTRNISTPPRTVQFKKYSSSAFRTSTSSPSDTNGYFYREDKSDKYNDYGRELSTTAASSSSSSSSDKVSAGNESKPKFHRLTLAEIIRKSLEKRRAYLDKFLRKTHTTERINYGDMSIYPDDSIKNYEIFVNDEQLPGPNQTCTYKTVLAPNSFTPSEEEYLKRRLSSIAFRNIGEVLMQSNGDRRRINDHTHSINFHGYKDYQMLELVSEENVKAAINSMLKSEAEDLKFSLDELKKQGHVYIKIDGVAAAVSVYLRKRNVAGKDVYDLTVLTGK